jgi:hypothetical protein
MIPYNFRIPSFALGVTTTPFGTIISGALRSFLIIEMDFQGRGTASADNEIGIYRIATAGVTGGGAITPTPLPVPNMTGTTPALAFSGTAFASYSTQPVAGALIQNMLINANGQRYFWRANPNLNNAIPVPGGNNAAGSVGLFPIAGSSNVGGRIQILEL